MKTYQEFIQDVEEDNNYSMLDEAGNFSVGIALKKHNDVIRFGKQVLKSADATDADKALARMIVASSGLSLMAVATSGEKSLLSTAAKGVSLRGI
mgnify:FL=1